MLSQHHYCACLHLHKQIAIDIQRVIYLNHSYIFIHISFISSYYLTVSVVVRCSDVYEEWLLCSLPWVCVGWSWNLQIPSVRKLMSWITITFKMANTPAPSSSWGRVWRCNISWMWQVLNEFKSAVLGCSQHHFGLTVWATVTGGRAFLVRWALPMSIALIFSCSCLKRLCSMSLYHDSWPGSPSALSLVHKNEGCRFAYRSHHFCSFWQQILGVSIVSIPPSSLAESVDPSLIHAYKLLKKSLMISPFKNGKTVPKSFSTPWWYGVHCG